MFSRLLEKLKKSREGLRWIPCISSAVSWSGLGGRPEGTQLSTLSHTAVILCHSPIAVGQLKNCYIDARVSLPTRVSPDTRVCEGMDTPFVLNFPSNGTTPPRSFDTPRNAVSILCALLRCYQMRTGCELTRLPWHSSL